MIRLDKERCIIGFDDGYQLGKTANFILDNGVHFLGSVESTLKENSLFYDGEYFKVGEGRNAGAGYEAGWCIVGGDRNCEHSSGEV